MRVAIVKQSALFNSHTEVGKSYLSYCDSKPPTKSVFRVRENC